MVNTIFTGHKTIHSLNDEEFHLFDYYHHCIMKLTAIFFSVV